jgi:glycosyltransferase involved in cell wall biosynthesis
MNNPKISVIVPAYNCAKYIEDSIRSLFVQSFKDFEIIIINDGSTDATFYIISSLISTCPEEFKDRIILINNKKNSGCFQSRTIGIKKAKGEYVLIHDADDISLPYRIEKQYNFLEKNKEVWCVGGHSININEEGKEIGYFDYPPEKNKDIIRGFVNCKNLVMDPTTMFRKDIFEKLGGYSFDHDRFLIGDMDLWVRSILSGEKISNLLEPLIKYRFNSHGNTLKYKKEMIRQHMIVYKEFMSKHKEN